MRLGLRQIAKYKRPPRHIGDGLPSNRSDHSRRWFETHSGSNLGKCICMCDTADDTSTEEGEALLMLMEVCLSDP